MRTAIALLLLATGAGAQLSNLASRRLTRGTTDPATCAVGDVFFNQTSATFKGCAVTNTWSDLLAVSGTGPSAVTLLTGSGANTISIVPTTSGATGTFQLPNTFGTFSLLKSVAFSTTDTLTAATIDTVETAFATTYTIPANYFVANRVLKATFVWQATTSGGAPTQRLRVKLGSTEMYDSTAVTVTNGQTTRGQVSVLYLQGTAAAGASVSVEAGWSPCGATPVMHCVAGNTIAQGVAVATNAQQILSATLQFSANTAGNTVTLRQLIVESLN